MLAFLLQHKLDNMPDTSVARSINCSAWRLVAFMKTAALAAGRRKTGYVSPNFLKNESSEI